MHPEWAEKGWIGNKWVTVKSNQMEQGTTMFLIALQSITIPVRFAGFITGSIRTFNFDIVWGQLERIHDEQLSLNPLKVLKNHLLSHP